MDRIIRKSELTSLDGLSTSTRARLIRAGKYPAPVQLGARCVGYRLEEILQWIADRPKVTGPTAAEDESRSARR